MLHNFVKTRVSPGLVLLNINTVPSLSSVIVRGSVGLKRTVVADSD